jgi:hypothetical protein
MFHCVVELFGGLGHHEMASIGDRDEVCVGNLVRQFAVEMGWSEPIPPAADHECGVVDIAQSVGGVVSEAGVALSRENLLGERCSVLDEELDHLVDQIGLLEGFVLQGPEHALANHHFDGGAAEYSSFSKFERPGRLLRAIFVSLYFKW